jgi:hypothetical protein
MSMKIGMSMKIAVAVVLIFGLPSLRVYAQPPVRRPCWVVVVTVIDRTTGERIKQTELRESELEFDEPAKCKAVVAMTHPVQNGDFTAVLTCRKVERVHAPGPGSGGSSSMPGQRLPQSEA